MDPVVLPGLGSTLATSLLSLALVCLLAYVTLRWLSRRAGGRLERGGPGPLQVLARLQLEPRRAVYLVRVGARGLLLGVGDGPTTLLAELPGEALRELGLEAPLTRSGTPTPGRFGELLSGLLGRSPLGGTDPAAARSRAVPGSSGQPQQARPPEGGR